MIVRCGRTLLVLVVFAACGTRASLLRAPAADAGDAGPFPTPPGDAGVEAKSADGPAVIDVERDRLVDAIEAIQTNGCGSQISFYLQADPGADQSTLCGYPCDYVHASFSGGSLQLGVSSELSYGTPVVWTSGQPAGGCVARCDTCQTSPGYCHSCPGLGPPFDVANRTWDGSYFVEGTCNGNRCIGGSSCAPPGHYVANLCVQRGVTSGGLCVPLYYLDGSAGPREACSSVEFDLQSTVSLLVNMGSARASGGAVDAGAAPDLSGLVGQYRVGTSSGGIGHGGTSTRLAFTEVDLSVAASAVADLLVTTNPLPGDFPGKCDIPLSLVTDESGQWSLQNRTTVACALAGATVTLYRGYYAMKTSNGNLVISAAGNTAGGTQSKSDTWGFAYSAVVVPVSAP